MKRLSIQQVFAKLSLVVGAGLLAAGCATGPDNTPKNLVDTAASAGQFNILSQAIKQAGLEETLKGTGPFTVFAPTDAAFNKIPKAQLDKLLADKEALKNVLTFHVLPGKVMSKAVTNASVKTVNGANVTVSRSGDFVGYDDALVTKADIEATNGVIHVIDTVVMPPRR
ncbi:fasciclin domain-containing protein [Parvibium lacunae]|uniref:Fasciclin domain-containing protein n=1 Tax=Parvibium lacunae TaxID=1888893 RepID=A0A368L3E4_9BURK|nr:fasciclin domain-containing protein [Parvibium lacunae]RCS58116.1 fasciclin domain-containing protein [Parvibium lacunae]